MNKSSSNMNTPPPKHSLSSPTTSNIHSPVLPTPSSSTSASEVTKQLRRELEQQIADKEKQLQDSSSGIGKSVLARQISQLKERLQEMDRRQQQAALLQSSSVSQQRQPGSSSPLRRSQSPASISGDEDLSPATLEKLQKLERDIGAYRALSPNLSAQRKERLRNGLDPLPSPSTSTMLLPAHGHDSTSLLPLPPPPSGSTPTKRRSKVPNADRRNTDIEFATEIGQGLLIEVRKMQALLQERDDQLKALQAQKADLERAAEAMAKQLRQKEENEEKLKEEAWNLELAKQELTVSVTELKQNLNRANAEQKRMAENNDELTAEIEHMRDREEKRTAKIEAMKQKYEYDVANLRRHSAGLQREKADFAKQVEALNSELAIAKAQSRITKRSHSELRPVVSAEQDREPSETEAAPAKERSSSGSTPPPSPKQLPSRNQALEVETLKTSLAHAHRMVSNLRSNLHREKTEKFELKKLLNEYQETIEQLQNDPRLWVDAGLPKTSTSTNNNMSESGSSSVRRLRKGKRRVPVSKTRVTRQPKGGESPDDSSDVEGRRKRKDSQQLVSDASSGESEEDNEYDDDDDDDEIPRSVLAAGATGAIAGASLGMVGAELPQPKQVGRTLGDELSAAFSGHGPQSLQASSTPTSTSATAPAPTFFDASIQTDGEPTPAPAYVRTHESSVQTASVELKDATLATFESAPSMQYDAETQCDTPVFLDAGIQHDKVNYVEQGVQHEAPAGVDAGVQQDRIGYVEQGVQHEYGSAVDAAAQYDAPSAVDAGIQYDKLEYVEHGVQHDTPAGIDAEIQYDKVEHVEQGVQHETALVVDAAIQSDAPNVVDTAIQYDQPKYVEQGIQHTGPAGIDAEMQYEKLQYLEQGVQYESTAAVDAAAQFDAPEMVDTGIQYDSVPAIHAASQHDAPVGVDAEIQHDKLEYVSQGVQHENVATADAETQFDPPAVHDQGIQHIWEGVDQYTETSVPDFFSTGVQSESTVTSDASIQYEGPEPVSVFVQYESVPFHDAFAQSDAAEIKDASAQCSLPEVHDMSVQSDIAAAIDSAVQYEATPSRDISVQYVPFESKDISVQYDAIPVKDTAVQHTPEVAAVTSVDAFIQTDELEHPAADVVRSIGAGAFGLGAIAAALTKSETSGDATKDVSKYEDTQGEKVFTAPAIGDDEHLNKDGAMNLRDIPTHMTELSKPIQGQMDADDQHNVTKTRSMPSEEQEAVKACMACEAVGLTKPTSAVEGLNLPATDKSAPRASSAAIESTNAAGPTDASEAHPMSGSEDCTANSLSGLGSQLGPAQEDVKMYSKAETEALIAAAVAEAMAKSTPKVARQKPSLASLAARSSIGGSYHHQRLDDDEATIPSRPSSPPPQHLLSLVGQSSIISSTGSVGVSDKGKAPMRSIDVLAKRNLPAGSQQQPQHTRPSSVLSSGSEPRVSFQSSAYDTSSLRTDADPSQIGMLTQTMIGDWLWKYTHKSIGGGLSDNRHRRFFWIHPYTRTLYWSTKAPGSLGNGLNTKSATLPGCAQR
ncbi:hypothetical protein BX666DRAFT_450825 [Dichotomocladium elegans]|nr:hypothetical protein BX666DRAFT_450825 [Dichotomocladium elegans]